MAAVEVEDLTIRYGTLTAVDGASFAAEAGAVTAVLGPNGAGKTSTIEVCEGYRSGASGSVRVLGMDPRTEQRRLSERMGVMLQDGGVYPSARVLDTVRHFCTLHGRGADPRQLVALVGLEQRAGATWRRLSGGERQRLSLALALAARPDVAFLDEPTSGVDINGRDAIRGIIRTLADGGCAVVLATHELDEAERVADRVVVFDSGQVIADGTLDELRRGSGEIRFRSQAPVDVRALASETGLIAAQVGPDEYVIDAPPLPRVMATLTGWLAERGHDLTDLRAGAQRLEDVFRRLTADRAAERAVAEVDAPPSEPQRRRRRRGTS
jgi:ABC-2 type transport system ATP-binding protein